MMITAELVPLIVMVAAALFTFGFFIGWKGGDTNGYERCLDDVCRRWKRRFE